MYTVRKYVAGYINSYLLLYFSTDFDKAWFSGINMKFLRFGFFKIQIQRGLDSREISFLEPFLKFNLEKNDEIFLMFKDKDRILRSRAGG